MQQHNNDNSGHYCHNVSPPCLSRCGVPPPAVFVSARRPPEAITVATADSRDDGPSSPQWASLFARRLPSPLSCAHPVPVTSPGGEMSLLHIGSRLLTRGSLSLSLTLSYRENLFLSVTTSSAPTVCSPIASLKYTPVFVSDFASLSSSFSPSLFLSILSFFSFSVLFSVNHSFLGSCHSPDLPSFPSCFLFRSFLPLFWISQSALLTHGR